MFKSSIATAVAFLIAMSGAASAVTVAGTSNLYLAGAVAGTNSGGFDTTENQSPVLGALVNSGDILNFAVNPDGLVGTSMTGNQWGPDGSKSIVYHMGGAENGISQIWAPSSALVGVFLNDDVPMGTAPAGLNFGSIGLDFGSLAPSLWQAFFIGDGLDAAGNAQDFIAPDGATRLFLGVMDSSNWSNNSGSFEVTVSGATGGDTLAGDDLVAPVPLPAAALLLLSGLGGLALVRRRS